MGIFKQKIVDGQQVELPDDWKNLGDAWLMPKPQETEEVHFGGKVRTRWDNGHLMVVHEDYTRVLAVPCDMEIAGYDTQQVNTLRLWDAKSPKPIDMKLFSEGQYLRAGEERAMADVISKVLYPEDNHYEGKSLRLKQQYFFVSATMQSITRQHIQTYGTLKNFHEKNVIQINDTHPALVIPELMRILVDDAGLSWDEAWHITTCSVAYTNHTVLAEALECWPQQLFETLLPRVWQILQEIARRWQEKVESFYHDPEKTAKMAVIWDGVVRMANLCIAGGMAINGVSALHSDILRHDVFRDACRMEPEKFKNVTNGVDHRRWLSQINPGLDGLIRELIGDGYLTHAGHLQELDTLTLCGYQFIVGFFPVIIEKQEWEQVQRLLKQQARPANGNQAKHRYAGLLTCQECGNTFIPMIRCWNGKSRVEYVCRGYHRNGKSYCSSHRIHEEVLDAAVQEYAETMREQCAEEVKKLAQMQKMWALRKPILDAHILSLQEKVLELEQEIDEIVMEKLRI